MDECPLEFEPDTWAMSVPIDAWLVHLIVGWRLPFVVEPIGGHHRHYSILLEREDAPA